jgi:hypothetical protein
LISTDEIFGKHKHRNQRISGAVTQVGEQGSNTATELANACQPARQQDYQRAPRQAADWALAPCTGGCGSGLARRSL